MLAGCCNLCFVDLVCAFSSLDDSMSLWISSTLKEIRRRHEPASCWSLQVVGVRRAGRSTMSSINVFYIPYTVNISATLARLGQLQTHAAT